MKIHVRLCGRYKDIVGKTKLELDVTQGDTIWYVVDAVLQRYPEIEKDKKFIMVSKNNVLANLTTKIEEGDEITIAPPVVSGG